MTDLRVLANPNTPVEPTGTSPVSRQARRWVSIGTVVLLRIGDLWRGQQWHCSPEHQTETFPGVNISKGSAHVFKVGHSFHRVPLCSAQSLSPEPLEKIRKDFLQRSIWPARSCHADQAEVLGEEDFPFITQVRLGGMSVPASDWFALQTSLPSADAVSDS